MLLERGQHILSLCDDTTAAVASMQDEAAGVLRVGSSGEFGTALNAQMLQAFRAAHPKIQLDLVFFAPSVFLDFSRQKVFDAVLSTDDDVGPGARGADDDALWVVCKPRLSGRPRHARRRGRAGGAQGRAVPRRGRGAALAADQRHGNGRGPAAGGYRHQRLLDDEILRRRRGRLALLPPFFTELEQRNGHLVPILPEWRTAPRNITLRVPDPRYVAPKTRAFIAFCKAYFQPGLDIDVPRYFVEALCFPDPSTGETP